MTPPTASDQATLRAGYTSTCFEHATKIGPISRRVLRRPRPGSTVILIHEAPGITDSTFRIAELLYDAGFAVVMPELLDAAPARAGLGTIVRLCVAREMGALASGETSAIADWVRALVDHESAANPGRPIGVIGMCFSGGFAFASIFNDKVKAAVVSQPALPFIWPRDLGVSKEDLAQIRERVRSGDACLRAMRFWLDWRSPAPRFHHLQKQFPRAETIVIPTLNPNDHSVLGRAVGKAPKRALVKALDDTIAFLKRNLVTDPAASAPSD